MNDYVSDKVVNTNSQPEIITGTPSEIMNILAAEQGISKIGATIEAVFRGVPNFYNAFCASALETYAGATGNISAEDDDWLEKSITRLRAKVEKTSQGSNPLYNYRKTILGMTAENLREGITMTADSVIPQLAGAAAFYVARAVPVVGIIAGAAAASTTAGAMMYPRAKYMFYRQVRDDVNAKRIENGLPPMSEEEWKEIREELKDEAHTYATSEALSETFEEAVTAVLMRTPFAKVAGKTLATTVARIPTRPLRKTVEFSTRVGLGTVPEVTSEAISSYIQDDAYRSSLKKYNAYITNKAVSEGLTKEELEKRLLSVPEEPPSVIGQMIETALDMSPSMAVSVALTGLGVRGLGLVSAKYSQKEYRKIKPQLPQEVQERVDKLSAVFGENINTIVLALNPYVNQSELSDFVENERMPEGVKEGVAELILTSYAPEFVMDKFNAFYDETKSYSKAYSKLLDYVNSIDFRAVNKDRLQNYKTLLDAQKFVDEAKRITKENQEPSVATEVEQAVKEPAEEEYIREEFFEEAEPIEEELVEEEELPVEWLDKRYAEDNIKPEQPTPPTEKAAKPEEKLEEKQEEKPAQPTEEVAKPEEKPAQPTEETKPEEQKEEAPKAAEAPKPAEAKPSEVKGKETPKATEVAKTVEVPQKALDPILSFVEEQEKEARALEAEGLPTRKFKIEQPTGKEPKVIQKLSERSQQSRASLYSYLKTAKIKMMSSPTAYKVAKAVGLIRENEGRDVVISEDAEPNKKYVLLTENNKVDYARASKANAVIYVPNPNEGNPKLPIEAYSVEETQPTPKETKVYVASSDQEEQELRKLKPELKNKSILRIDKTPSGTDTEGLTAVGANLPLYYASKFKKYEDLTSQKTYAVSKFNLYPFIQSTEKRTTFQDYVKNTLLNLYSKARIKTAKTKLEYSNPLLFMENLIKAIKITKDGKISLKGVPQEEARVIRKALQQPTTLAYTTVKDIFLKAKCNPDVFLEEFFHYIDFNKILPDDIKDRFIEYCKKELGTAEFNQIFIKRGNTYIWTQRAHELLARTLLNAVEIMAKQHISGEKARLDLIFDNKINLIMDYVSSALPTEFKADLDKNPFARVLTSMFREGDTLARLLNAYSDVLGLAKNEKEYQAKLNDLRTAFYNKLEPLQYTPDTKEFLFNLTFLITLNEALKTRKELEAQVRSFVAQKKIAPILKKMKFVDDLKSGFEGEQELKQEVENEAKKKDIIKASDINLFKLIMYRFNNMFPMWSIISFINKIKKIEAQYADKPELAKKKKIEAIEERYKQIGGHSSAGIIKVFNIISKTILALRASGADPAQWQNKSLGALNSFVMNWITNPENKKMYEQEFSSFEAEFKQILLKNKEAIINYIAEAYANKLSISELIELRNKSEEDILTKMRLSILSDKMLIYADKIAEDTKPENTTQSLILKSRDPLADVVIEYGGASIIQEGIETLQRLDKTTLPDTLVVENISWQSDFLPSFVKDLTSNRGEVETTKGKREKKPELLDDKEVEEKIKKGQTKKEQETDGVDYVKIVSNFAKSIVENGVETLKSTSNTILRDLYIYAKRDKEPNCVEALKFINDFLVKTKTSLSQQKELLAIIDKSQIVAINEATHTINSTSTNYDNDIIKILQGINSAIDLYKKYLTDDLDIDTFDMSPDLFSDIEIQEEGWEEYEGTEAKRQAKEKDKKPLFARKDIGRGVKTKSIRTSISSFKRIIVNHIPDRVMQRAANSIIQSYDDLDKLYDDLVKDKVVNKKTKNKIQQDLKLAIINVVAQKFSDDGDYTQFRKWSKLAASLASVAGRSLRSVQTFPLAEFFGNVEKVIEEVNESANEACKGIVNKIKKIFTDGKDLIAALKEELSKTELEDIAQSLIKELGWSIKTEKPQKKKKKKEKPDDLTDYFYEAVKPMIIDEMVKSFDEELKKASPRLRQIFGTENKTKPEKAATMIGKRGFSTKIFDLVQDGFKQRKSETEIMSVVEKYTEETLKGLATKEEIEEAKTLVKSFLASGFNKVCAGLTSFIKAIDPNVGEKLKQQFPEQPVYEVAVEQPTPTTAPQGLPEGTIPPVIQFTEEDLKEVKKKVEKELEDADFESGEGDLVEKIVEIITISVLSFIKNSKTMINVEPTVADAAHILSSLIIEKADLKKGKKESALSVFAIIQTLLENPEIAEAAWNASKKRIASAIITDKSYNATIEQANQIEQMEYKHGSLPFNILNKAAEQIFAKVSVSPVNNQQFGDNGLKSIRNIYNIMDMMKQLGYDERSQSFVVPKNLRQFIVRAWNTMSYKATKEEKIKLKLTFINFVSKMIKNTVLPTNLEPEQIGSLLENLLVNAGTSFDNIWDELELQDRIENRIANNIINVVKSNAIPTSLKANKILASFINKQMLASLPDDLKVQLTQKRKTPLEKKMMLLASLDDKTIEELKTSLPKFIEQIKAVIKEEKVPETLRNQLENLSIDVAQWITMQADNSESWDKIFAPNKEIVKSFLNTALREGNNAIAHLITLIKKRFLQHIDSLPKEGTITVIKEMLFEGLKNELLSRTKGYKLDYEHLRQALNDTIDEMVAKAAASKIRRSLPKPRKLYNPVVMDNKIIRIAKIIYASEIAKTELTDEEMEHIFDTVAEMLGVSKFTVEDREYINDLLGKILVEYNTTKRVINGELTGLKSGDEIEPIFNMNSPLFAYLEDKLNEKIPPSRAEQFFAILFGNLFSGFSTQETNFINTFLNTISYIPLYVFAFYSKHSTDKGVLKEVFNSAKKAFQMFCQDFGVDLRTFLFGTGLPEGAPISPLTRIAVTSTRPFLNIQYTPLLAFKSKLLALMRWMHHITFALMNFSDYRFGRMAFGGTLEIHYRYMIENMGYKVGTPEHEALLTLLNLDRIPRRMEVEELAELLKLNKGAINPSDQFFSDLVMWNNRTVNAFIAALQQTLHLTADEVMILTNDGVNKVIDKYKTLDEETKRMVRRQYEKMLFALLPKTVQNNLLRTVSAATYNSKVDPVYKNTFLGKIAGFMDDLKGERPDNPVKFLARIFGVAANMLNRVADSSLEWSPIGFVRANYMQRHQKEFEIEPTAIDVVRLKGIIGTSLLATLFLVMARSYIKALQEGEYPPREDEKELFRINLLGPRDPKQRAVWLQYHSPRTIEIMGKSFPLSWTPMAIPLAFLGFIDETIRYNLTDHPDEEDKIFGLATALAQASFIILTDNTALNAISEFTTAMISSEQTAATKGSELIAKLSITAVPYLGSNALRQIIDFMDGKQYSVPYTKDAYDKFVSQLLKYTPIPYAFKKEFISPMLNELGEVIEKPSPSILLATLAKASGELAGEATPRVGYGLGEKREPDHAWYVLAKNRLGLRRTLPNTTLNGIVMNDELLFAYIALKGKLRKGLILYLEPTFDELREKGVPSETVQELLDNFDEKLSDYAKNIIETSPEFRGIYEDYVKKFITDKEYQQRVLRLSGKVNVAKAIEYIQQSTNR